MCPVGGRKEVSQEEDKKREKGGFCSWGVRRQDDVIDADGKMIPGKQERSVVRQGKLRGYRLYLRFE
jgi:hypothetical protein